MTEADWKSATDPRRMLTWLREQGLLSDRKARLFACAFGRCLDDVVGDADCRRAVEVAERVADGHADPEDLQQAGDVARAVWAASRWEGLVAAGAAEAEGRAAASSITAALEMDGIPPAYKRLQVGLLRDIFNPFDSSQFDRAWRTPTVLALATTIYADRTFDNLPILADALEEVGCTDAELLGHLRGPGPHAGRGCWAVDVVLGKS